MVFAFRLLLGQHRAKIGQHMFQMGRHSIKMGQHRAQIGPTWPSRGDTAPNMGQHGPHTWANLAPKRPPTWGEPGGEPGGEPSVAWGFGFFCGIFVCVCFFIRLLACLARMLGQHSSTSRPRRTNIALRRPNIAPRWANIAPRWTNIASKMGQHSFKARQHSPKISQHSPQPDQHSFEDGATAPSPPFPLCWPAPGCQASAFKSGDAVPLE